MIEYPRHYFEDEVREGFYITGMLKRIWAAQLEVLADIDKVCKRHNIKWFADCGTLMGVVRHGGYIPWDDDMDICMLRDDYERFLKIASEEMPEDGYFVFNLHYDEFYEHFLSRVTNGHGLNFDDKFLEKFHDCYLPIGIDIFPIDYLSRNKEYEENRFVVAKQVFNAGDHIKQQEERKEEYEQLLLETEKLLGKTYDKSRSMKQRFYEAADDVFSLVSPMDSDEVVLMCYWLGFRNHKYKLASFRETVNMPFEFTELPVPVEYDNVLKVEYGDYMRPVKAGGVHEYPFFEKMEDKLVGMVDNYILKYKFSPADLKNDDRDSTDHVKAQVTSYLNTTEEAHMAVIASLAGGNAELCLKLLAACQESAINIGNLIEKAYGEGYEAVASLEAYCEGIYELYNAIAGGEFGSADAVGVQTYIETLLADMKTALSKYVTERKEMVFIPYRADYWDGLHSMWEEAIAAGEYDVTVVPIPYYKKTAMGGYADEYYEGKEFPDFLNITDYHDYNFKLRHPDIIVTQQPYDECNYCIGVGTEYYSRVLKKYTEQLIYVTPFVLDEIEDRNGKAWKTMDYFCTVPGISHADKVMVQSESMRRSYIDKLVEFTGEEYREVWEKKIDGSGVPLQKAIEKRKADKTKAHAMDSVSDEWRSKIEKTDGSLRKIVLFNMGVATLAQYGGKAVDKLEQVLRVFKENREEITLVWHSNAHARKTMKKLDLVTRDRFARCIENYKSEDWGLYTESTEYTSLIELADAYYGDAGHEAHEMRLLKKPVMLLNVEITD